MTKELIKKELEDYELLEFIYKKISDHIEYDPSDSYLMINGEYMECDIKLFTDHILITNEDSARLSLRLDYFLEKSFDEAVNNILVFITND